MDEYDALIKELRVDWDGVLSEDFNPLAVSLHISMNSKRASDFREMLHRLEFTMEKIIAANYKGFSDSVLSYNEVNRHNTGALEALREMEAQAMQIKLDRVDLGGITAEKEMSGVCEAKYGICKGVGRVKQILDELSGDLQTRSHAIVAALDSIDNKDYVKIKAVDEFRKVVYRKYTDIVEEVNEMLCGFVFKNQQENLQYFECVKVLGSLYELEQFFMKAFHARLFSEIEETIMSFYRASGSGLERLCRGVAAKFESVEANVLKVIELAVRNFEIDRDTGTFSLKHGPRLPDFFGKLDTTFSFCVDGNVALGIIKEELKAFIYKYQDSLHGLAFDFSLNYIIDDLDYASLYPPSHPILHQLSQSKRQYSNKSTGYTVVTATGPEVVEFLAKYVHSPALSLFLREEIGNLYIEHGFERDKRTINGIFSGEPLKRAGESDRLALVAAARTIFKPQYQEHQESLKHHFVERLLACLNRVYRETFTSELVVEPDAQSTADNLRSVPAGAFRESLITKAIKRKDLLLSKQRYGLVVAVINSLGDLSALLLADKIADLRRTFVTAFRQQLNIEFFYFFDHFYRQGHFNHYMRKIVDMLAMVYAETRSGTYFETIYENLEYYCIHNTRALNVRTRDELAQFVGQLRILDEVMGEVEFYSDLKKVYEFFGAVLAGESDTKYGKALEKKIEE
ncbi:hypothetical protein PAPHI01_1647 [Pancytospora philotis]|nr:hypothetical protein PAPHI01_1647 [Pancytospora philotis]